MDELNQIENAHLNECQTVEIDKNDISPIEPLDKFKIELNFENLPDLLKTLCCSFDEEHRVMMLLSNLTVVSSILPNVFGWYAGKKIYPNLYLYILGKAGSGKGEILWSKRLLSAIEEYKPIDTSSGLLEMLNSREVAVTSRNKILIPANNSSAGFVKILNDRDGNGLVFESEGDTIANAFKSDYGNYSDILRKAFHHEAVTQYRKTENVYVELNEPKLSVVISSTPNQLKRIITNAENGLFSRFMYYITEPIDGFMNVFTKSSVDRSDVFRNGAEKLLALYHNLLVEDEIQFSFTYEQQEFFLTNYETNKSIMVNMFHEDLDGTVHRMGIISFRIAMILSVLRNVDSSNGKTLVCLDEDFVTALALSEILLKNAFEVLNQLPTQAQDSLSEAQRNLFVELSTTFTTAEAKRVGRNHGLSERSVDRFLNSACFEKVSHGNYRKAS